MSDSVVVVSNLTVVYANRVGRTIGANDVSLSIRRQETVALVGASGSGKSTIGRAAIGLLPSGSRGSTSGCVTLFGVSAMDASRQEELRRVRYTRVGYVPQEPHASLNPLMRVRTQVLERGFASRNALLLLQDLGIDHPGRIMDSFPQALSGGEAQRVALARALSVPTSGRGSAEFHDGRLLVVDEPTAALDPVAKVDLLCKLRGLRESGGWSTLLISHDLQAAAAVADRVLVIEQGRIADQAGRGEPALVLPAHSSELTRRLALQSTGGEVDGKPDRADRRCAVVTPTPRASVNERASALVLSFDSVSYAYPPTTKDGRGSACGIVDVSLSIQAGSCIGVVGASGSGKTTVLRLAGGSLTPNRGEVRWTHAVAPQLVPQDFGSSFTPWLRVGSQIAEFLPRAERRARKREIVASLLSDVGLSPELAYSRPDQMSGGQKQRAAIARALAAKPAVLLLDEPTAALDSNSAHQLASLLARLRMSRGVTMVLASHDLNLIRAACEMVVVLENGRVVETGVMPDTLLNPARPATARLIAFAEAVHLGHWDVQGGGDDGT